MKDKETPRGPWDFSGDSRVSDNARVSGEQLSCVMAFPVDVLERRMLYEQVLPRAA